MSLRPGGDGREREEGGTGKGGPESELPPVFATLQEEMLETAFFDVEKYVEQLAAMGHPVRFATLYGLVRDGEMPRKSIEQHTGQDGNALQTHLDVLEERGLVRKRRDPDDERRRLYRLTDSGVELTEAVLSKMEDDGSVDGNLTPMSDRY